MKQALSRAATIASVVIALCLAGCAAEPDTAEIDYVTSEAEADQRYADCMEEKGWEPSVDPNGGVEIGGHESQIEKLTADGEECDSRPEMQSKPWTDEDYRLYYEAVSKVADCVAAAGYDVPEKPSLQVFIDQIKGVASEDQWYPHENVPDSDLSKMLNTCPEPDGF